MAHVEKNTPSSPNPGTINVTLFFYGLMYETKTKKHHNNHYIFLIMIWEFLQSGTSLDNIRVTIPLMVTVTC